MGSKNSKPALSTNHLIEISQIEEMAELEWDLQKLETKFNDFVRVHPNGKISKKHFKAIMSKAVPRIKHKMDTLGTHIFRVYDTNNDGFISFVEFMVVYHVMSEGTVEQVLGKMFRMFDVNDDGTISVEEIKRLVKDLYKLVVDSQADPATPEEIVRGVVAEMDKNEDRKITKDEFISACLANEPFTKVITFEVVDIFNDIYVDKKECEVDVDWDNYKDATSVLSGKSP